MNDDLNLSELLQEQPVPQDGAQRARQTATRRRHRRQAIAGSFGAILLVGAATTAILQTDIFDDKTVVIRDAGSSNETTTTTAPTTTTTTTAPDPRQRYVGVEHDESGAGLPLGTAIKLSGTPEPAPFHDDGSGGDGRTTKVGDTLLFWTRDAKGDMLWIDTVTKAPKSYQQPLFAKVQAVFDLPAIGEDQYTCIGWCGKTDGKPAPGIIGIYKTDAHGKDTFSYAARVDVDKRTLVEIPTKGLTSWPSQQQGPVYPTRPELYNVISGMNQADREWIQANEGVVINGGGNFDGLDFEVVEDFQQNKEIFTAKKADKRAQVIVDSVLNGDFNFGGGETFTYKGKASGTMLVYVERNPQSNDQPIIRAAYTFDADRFEFKQVANADVGFVPAATVP